MAKSVLWREYACTLLRNGVISYTHQAVNLWRTVAYRLDLKPPDLIHGSAQEGKGHYWDASHSAAFSSGLCEACKSL